MRFLLTIILLSTSLMFGQENINNPEVATTASNQGYLLEATILDIPDSGLRGSLINHDINHGTNYNITDNGDGTITVPDITIVDTLIVGTTLLLEGIQQFSYLKYLDFVVYSFGEIPELKFENHSRIEKIYSHSDTRIDYVTLLNCSSFVEFRGANAYVDSMTINNCNSFERISWGTFGIGIVKLRILDCNGLINFSFGGGDNGISHTEIEKCINIESIVLGASHNSLTVNECPELTSIGIFDDEGFKVFDSLSISDTPKLETLSIGTADIKTVDVSKVNNLKLLKLGNDNGGSGTSEVFLNPSLEELYIHQSEMTRLNLSKNTLLQILDTKQTIHHTFKNPLPIIYVPELTCPH